jgi:hypothetical protein
MRSRPFTAELTRNPNDFDANLYLGIMLKDDGKLDEAHEHLKRAQRLRSRDVAVQYASGGRCISPPAARRRRGRLWRS